MTHLPTIHASRVNISVIVMVLVAVILVIFMILPELRAISAANAEIAAKREELSLAVAEIRSYEQATAQLAQVADGQELLAQIFPDREAMVVEVEELEAAASRSGAEYKITITDSKEAVLAPGAKKEKLPEPITGLAGVEQIPYSLEIKGSYGQITNFLAYVENSKALTTVYQAHFVAESKQDNPEAPPRNTGAGTATIDGVLFIKKSP